MTAITPFIILLIVAIILNYIPMDQPFKHICNIIVGVVALLLILQFAHIL